jgi:3-hydroxybutyryl-CoA dehydrogenase
MCLEKVSPLFFIVRNYTDSVLQGTATRDDIDKTLKLGMNHPMGPLQLGGYRLFLDAFWKLISSTADLYSLSSHDTRQFLLTRFYSIGLDTCLAIQQTLYEGTRDSKYRPSILLERMVDANWLGKKNGKGFYEY